MPILELLFAFALGAILGSFINALVFRLGTGISMEGRSACMHCGITIAWFDLVPVASFVVLRGRCRECKTRLSVQYPIVEALLGLLFLGTVANFGLSVQSLILFGFFATLLAIVVYDIRHTIIPDKLLIFLLAFSLLYMIIEIGSPLFGRELLFHIISALGAFFFFAALWFISRGRWMGFGDAKLALVLGFMFLPAESFTAIVLSFWVGAVVSVGVLALERLIGKRSRRLSLSSEVPFAPFLAAGYTAMIFFNLNITTLLSF